MTGPRGICVPLGGGAIACRKACWDCRFDKHMDPPQAHSWGDVDDFDTAYRHGDPPPGNCACPCADAPAITPEEQEAQAAAASAAEAQRLHRAFAQVQALRSPPAQKAPPMIRIPHRHILLVVDRSGSMAGKEADTEGGIAHLLAEQAKEPGLTTVSLVQFDHVIETVYEGRDINNVPPYKLDPRGGTALLEAIGASMTDLQVKIKALPKAERPDEVIVVVASDGEENSSKKEWPIGRVRALIQRRTARRLSPADGKAKRRWTVLFIGADIDAFTVAASMGVGRAQTLSCSGPETGRAYATASGVISAAVHTGEYVMPASVIQSMTAGTMPKDGNDD